MALVGEPRCRTRLARALAAVATLAVLGRAAVTVAGAQAPRTASETEIKAAYLYHFGKFVDWPPDAMARATFVVCVLRDEGFVATFREQVGRKQIQDKAVEVRLVSAAEEARGCHVLYLGDAPGDEAVLPSDAERRGMLVVADGEGATGSALSFVLQGDNVRFVADLRAAQQAGLTLSSQLLKLALDVVGGPGEEG